MTHGCVTSERATSVSKLTTAWPRWPNAPISTARLDRRPERRPAARHIETLAGTRCTCSLAGQRAIAGTVGSLAVAANRTRGAAENSPARDRDRGNHACPLGPRPRGRGGDCRLASAHGLSAHPRSQRFAPLGRLWAWLDWFGAAVARELGRGVLADWCRPPSAWCSTATRTGRAPRTTPGAGPLDPDLRVLGGGARAAVEVRCWSPGGDTTFVLSLADVVRGRPSCRDRFPEGTPRLLSYRA